MDIKTKMPEVKKSDKRRELRDETRELLFDYMKNLIMASDKASSENVSGIAHAAAYIAELLLTL